jgi:hypothetical protein
MAIGGIIEVAAKPRFRRYNGMWRCDALVERVGWLFDKRTIVTAHGETVREAWSKWVAARTTLLGKWR